MDRRRLAAAALGVAALVAASAWVVSRPDTPERTAYELVIRDSAAAAAREVGLDLEQLLRRSAEQILDRLPQQRPVRIEVKVEADQSLVIPETGYGGRAGLDVVFLSVERPLREGAETWLPATLAHELHHVSRFRIRPPFRGTLAESLVSEGLADHFAEEVYPDTPSQPWDHALTPAQEAAVWRRAQPILTKPRGYDHEAWFFGARPSELPRWTGYTLGHRIVAAYLGDERSAADAVGVDPAVVIESYVAGR